MDVKQLEKQVKEITELQDSIKQTSSYCSAFPENSGLVSFIIENEFISARKERKKLYLFLIHQIIQDEKAAKRREHQYVKSFGQKLKVLIQDYSQQVDDIGDLDKAYSILRKWEKEQIYHPIFIDKLRAILQVKYDELKQQQMVANLQLQNELASNRILVQNLQFIQYFDSTYKLYLHLKSLKDIDNRCLEFNISVDKYLLKAEAEKMDDHEMIDELIIEGNTCVTYLSEIICNTQNHSLDLSKLGEEIEEKFNLQIDKTDHYKQNRPIQ